MCRFIASYNAYRTAVKRSRVSIARRRGEPAPQRRVGRNLVPSPALLKAASPAMMPIAMKRSETMPQMTPQQTGEPP